MKMNERAISFDEAYNPEADDHACAHGARYTYIKVQRRVPDMVRPLLD